MIFEALPKRIFGIIQYNPDGNNLRVSGISNKIIIKEIFDFLATGMFEDELECVDAKNKFDDIISYYKYDSEDEEEDDREYDDKFDDYDDEESYYILIPYNLRNIRMIELVGNKAIYHYSGCEREDYEVLDCGYELVDYLEDFFKDMFDLSQFTINELNVSDQIFDQYPEISFN